MSHQLLLHRSQLWTLWLLEQCSDTWQSWKYPSAVPPVGSTAHRCLRTCASYIGLSLDSRQQCICCCWPKSVEHLLFACLLHTTSSKKTSYPIPIVTIIEHTDFVHQPCSSLYYRLLHTTNHLTYITLHVYIYICRLELRWDGLRSSRGWLMVYLQHKDDQLCQDTSSIYVTIMWNTLSL